MYFTLFSTLLKPFTYQSPDPSLQTQYDVENPKFIKLDINNPPIVGERGQIDVLDRCTRPSPPASLLTIRC
jgi:hypothetical protein